MGKTEEIEKTILKEFKPETVQDAIDVSMTIAKEKDNEIFFTFSKKKVTSDILEGGNEGIVIKQPLDVKGGSFHTHPKKGFCMFSATDIVDDFIKKDRDEAIVGCPHEGKIVKLKSLKFKPFVKSMVNTLVDEMSLEKYNFAVQKVDDIYDQLSKKMPEKKDEFDKMRERSKDDILHGENSDYDVYKIAMNHDFTELYNNLNRVVDEEDWTEEGRDEEEIDIKNDKDLEKKKEST